MANERIVKSLRCLALLVFFLKSAECLYVFAHGDALNYHLVGARFWLETSWLEMTHDLYLNFQSGLFDVIYLLPVVIFGPHIGAQVMGQWLHFFFSIGIGSVVLWRYFKSREREDVGLLAAITLLTISNSGDFFLYAKNDGVVALLALLFVLQLESKRWMLLGLLLGLIPAVKMSGLILIPPLVVALIARARPSARSLAIVCSVALLGVSPILIRNWYFLDSPFFPGLVGLFPGSLTPGMIEYYKSFTIMPLTVPTLTLQLKAFFIAKGVFLLAPIFLFRKVDRMTYWISLFVFITYMAMNGGYFAPRYFFACYFLTVFFIFQSLPRLQLKYVLLILALILLDSKLDLSVRRAVEAIQAHSSSTEAEEIRKYSPWSAIWQSVEPVGTRTWVLSDHFSDQFYSPRGVRLIQTRIHPDAEFLLTCPDATELKRYAYAIIALENTNSCYEKILKEGRLLTSIDMYRLYDIRGL